MAPRKSKKNTELRRNGLKPKKTKNRKKQNSNTIRAENKPLRRSSRKLNTCGKNNIQTAWWKQTTGKSRNIRLTKNDDLKRKQLCNQSNQSKTNSIEKKCFRGSKRKWKSDDVQDELIENTVHVNDLPSEVLCNILKYLKSDDRKNARLVCQFWYDNCNRNEKIVIRNGFYVEEIANIQKILQNCRFVQLNLVFQGVAVNKLPQTFWKICGSKIHSLEFYKCQLGNETMKNVISFCNNLRHLRLHVLLIYESTALCSPTILEKLVRNGVIKRELQTLKIHISDYEENCSQSTWTRLFKIIYQIFPSIVRVDLGRFVYCSEDSEKVLHVCKFTRNTKVPNAMDEAQLSTILSNLTMAVFTSNEWLNSLDLLSTLRLKKFYLRMYETTHLGEDGLNHLKKFFTGRKELNSVRVEFHYKVKRKELKSILFEIVENCLDLHKLRYLVYPYTHFLSANKFVSVLAKIPKVRQLSIGGLYYSYNSLSSLPSSTFKMLNMLELYDIPDEKVTIFLIQNHIHLQHLILKRYVSDDILQNIFKHLTNLKTLDIHIHRESNCTNFGITGRHDSLSTVIELYPKLGYSIGRLKNLERLAIDSCSTKIDNNIFFEFDFPKLQYFRCFLRHSVPKNVFHIARKMPSLKGIEFLCSDKTCRTVVSLCVLLRNLYDLHINLDPYVSEVEKIFDSCSSLRFVTTGLEGNHPRTYCYDPFTKKVIPKYRFKMKFYWK